MVLHLGNRLVAGEIILTLLIIITSGFYYVVLYYTYTPRYTHTVPKSYKFKFAHGSIRFVVLNLVTVNSSLEERKQTKERIDVEQSNLDSSDLTAQTSDTKCDVHGYVPKNDTVGSPEQLCDMTRFKSWRQGVVTEMRPVIRRNCEKIATNDKEEVDRVTYSLKDWKNEESDAQFVLRMSNCSYVMEEFSNNFYVSPEERNFPLAFIFVVYKNARQVVRLLKAIYRPDNLYCIHPDARQGKDFARVFHQISKYLDNVFVASKLEKVYYMHHSILDAQLNCVQDLLKYDQSRWRYVINLVGRELPLQTNHYIVKLLKRANNISIVDSHPIEKSFFNDRFRFKTTVNHISGRVYSTGQELSAIPHAIKIYKGSTHFALTWHFAHFLLTNQKAIDFRQYLNDVWMPEEEFYASLYHIPEAENHGGYSGNMALPVSYLEICIWLIKKHTISDFCSGLKVHSVCIVATGDLSRVYKLGVSKGRFFFNKYFMEVDHVIMDCIEERLVQQNKLEYAQDVGCSLSSRNSSFDYK